MEVDFQKFREAITTTSDVTPVGSVTRIIGLVIEGDGPDVPVGSVCRVYPRGGEVPIDAEVVGFRDGRVLMMPLANPMGIGPNSRIEALEYKPTIPVDDKILGRVLDGLGDPIDDKGALTGKPVSIYADPINPITRKRISEPLDVGIKAVDGLLTIGRGQRVGILAGTGVGKSVLLGQMAQFSNADVAVIGFIGERGREVREFIEKNLGEEGMKKTVIVTATSDNTPLVRLRAAYTATAIAEYFREQGKDVLLMVDSLTRFSMAQREIGLSIGEPPATKGYTPSVFALLPKLLERAGTKGEDQGSITGIYTVLVEGDDISEPISDAARAILDGHVVLSRALASKGHFPAIDVLASISRLMIDITEPEHMQVAEKARRLLAVYRDAEELINIGAYVKGSNPEIDEAINKIGPLNNFLRQRINEQGTISEAIQRLKEIV